jgi:2-amino-4-hydroxy-6-hydroxymethyldihydropteridine diphosphokinase
MSSEGPWTEGDFSKAVVIALGSNLGASEQILQEAMARLQEFSDQPLRCSSLWRTSPVGCPPGSPWFFNAVVVLAPREHETPEGLLARLLALEKEFGRGPTTVRNAPRPLDLDLIAFGRETRATRDLVLPHPRTHLRRFVLQPLAEIAAELVLPGQTEPVKSLLARLGDAEVLERLS